MGVKTLIRNIKSLSDTAIFNVPPLNQPGMRNGMAGMDFMTYTGGVCEEGFCVSLKDMHDIQSAYERCSTLKTVVNRNAMSMVNGKIWIVDENDNDVSDKYPALSKLFQNPNPLQTWAEFEMQLDVFRQLFGEVFIYSVAPVGYGPRDTAALWVINPRFVEIELSGRLYSQSNADDIIMGYKIGAGHEFVERGRMIHIKDVSQNMDFSATDIRGRSRLRGLENSIKNIIQAEEALYALNRDRGAQGMLSPKERDLMPPTPIEKENRLKTYKETYGILKNQSKILIPSVPMDYVRMGFNTKELMLIEGMDKNIQIVASVMGYPYELLGLMSGSSLNSNSGRFENELKKMMYQDNIIPISNIYCEKYTDFFELEPDDKIIKDFSEIESLRTAESDLAETLSKKASALHQLFVDGALSIEEYRLALGYDEDIHGKTTVNGEEQ